MVLCAGAGVEAEYGAGGDTVVVIVVPVEVEAFEYEVDVKPEPAHAEERFVASKGSNRANPISISKEHHAPLQTSPAHVQVRVRDNIVAAGAAASVKAPSVPHAGVSQTQTARHISAIAASRAPPASPKQHCDRISETAASPSASLFQTLVPPAPAASPSSSAPKQAKAKATVSSQTTGTQAAACRPESLTPSVPPCARVQSCCYWCYSRAYEGVLVCPVATRSLRSQTIHHQRQRCA